MSGTSAESSQVNPLANESLPEKDEPRATLAVDQSEDNIPLVAAEGDDACSRSSDDDGDALGPSHTGSPDRSVARRDPALNENASPLLRSYAAAELDDNEGQEMSEIRQASQAEDPGQQAPVEQTTIVVDYDDAEAAEGPAAEYDDEPASPTIAQDKEHSATTAAALTRLRESDEVHISSIAHYLKFSVLKVATLRGLIPHVLLVIFLTMATLLGKRADNGSELNLAVTRYVFDDEKASSVRTVPDATAFIVGDVLPSVYDVTSSVATNRALGPDKAALTPLHDVAIVGLVSVRVLRGKRSRCESNQGAFLPEFERNLSSGSASNGCLTEEEFTDYPIKSTPAELYSGHRVAGFLRQQYSALSVVSPQNALQVTMPLNSSGLADTITAANTMLTYNPSDILAIVAETVFFDSATTSLVRATYLYERRNTATRSTTITFPFNIKALDGGAWPSTLFAIDVALCALVLYLAVEVIFALRLNWHLLTSEDSRLEVLGWWECYNMILIVVLGAMLGVKMFGWVTVNSLPDEMEKGPTATFSAVVSYSDTYELNYVGLAWLLMLVYLRTFMFLRYSVRLSVINETIGSCIHEMIGVWVILIWVFIAFGVAAVIIWGHRGPLIENKSFYDSTVYLFLYLLNGESNTYSEYDAADTASARVFFLLFFLLSWVVMLNVVVGVLALSFASVTETMMMMQRPSWSPAAVVRDVTVTIKRMKAPIGLSTTFSEFATQRYRLLQALDLWQTQGIENTVSGEEYLSLKRMLQYTRRTFPPNFIRHVFVKASQQVGTYNARLRQLRLTNRAINNGVTMRLRLDNQAGLIDRLHRKVVIQKRIDASKAVHLMAVASPAYNVTKNDITEVGRRIQRMEVRHSWERDAHLATSQLLRRIVAMTTEAVSLLESADRTKGTSKSNDSSQPSEGYRGRSAFTNNSGAESMPLPRSRQQRAEEIERERQRRQLLIACSDEEGDMRYEIRTEGLRSLDLFYVFLRGYLKIHETGIPELRRLVKSSREMGAELKRQHLEKRRKADEAVRKEKLEEIELRRKASLAAALKAAEVAKAEEQAKAAEEAALLRMSASAAPGDDSREPYAESMSSSSAFHRQKSPNNSEPFAENSIEQPQSQAQQAPSAPRTSMLMDRPDGTFQIRFNAALEPAEGGPPSPRGSPRASGLPRRASSSLFAPRNLEGAMKLGEAFAHSDSPPTRASPPPRTPQRYPPGAL